MTQNNRIPYALAASFPETLAEPRKTFDDPTSDGLMHLEAVDWAMRRYADGDNSAFAEVYGCVAPKLLSFLRRLSGSSEIAEDLAQETFLCMHRARGSFARGRRVTPWAYAIARNCYIDRGRSLQARLARVSDDVADVVVVAGPDASGEECTMARQSAQVVHRTLSSMTEARREAFMLLRYEGMSVETAAQQVGIAEGALKLRAFHAYELVRCALNAMVSLPPGAPSAAHAPVSKRHTQANRLAA